MIKVNEITDARIMTQAGDTDIKLNFPELYEVEIDDDYIDIYDNAPQNEEEWQQMFANLLIGIEPS